MPTIEIRRIDVRGRLRDADPGKVGELAESIAEVGLINPITVVARRIMIDSILDDGYVLVAGLHRLEASKSLGLVEIEASVVDADDLHRKLIEVDENYCRTEMGRAERALFAKEGKAIHECLYPETANGATGRGREKVRQVGEPTTDRFTAHLSAKSGQSERSIQRDVHRGENVVVLSEVKGTCLDKGRELDALAKLTHDQQRALATRARAGEKVSAYKVVSAEEAVTKQVERLVKAWNAAGPDARDRFLTEIDGAVFDNTAAGNDRVREVSQ